MSSSLVSQEYFGFHGMLTHENDFLGINNEDDNYTGGAELEFVLPNSFIGKLLFGFRNGLDFLIIGLGATAYTPQDLESEEVVQGDRPYASLTYVKVGRQSISASFDKQMNSQIVVGLTGWQGPGEVQFFIHDRGILGTTRPNPKGWDNQIGFNGSLVINYNFRYVQEFRNQFVGNVDLELLRPFWMVGGDLGNYMVNLKLGLFINLINFNGFPILGGNGLNIPTKRFLSTGTGEYKRRFFRTHFYFEPRLNLIGYNVTLQGLMFGNNSPYTIPSTEINRMVFDFEAGIRALIADRFYIGYFYNLRTKEFSGGKNLHAWGGLTIGYSPLKWVTHKKKKQNE